MTVRVDWPAGTGHMWADADPDNGRVRLTKSGYDHWYLTPDEADKLGDDLKAKAARARK